MAIKLTFKSTIKIPRGKKYRSIMDYAIENIIGKRIKSVFTNKYETVGSVHIDKEYIEFVGLMGDRLTLMRINNLWPKTKSRNISLGYYKMLKQSAMTIK